MAKEGLRDGISEKIKDLRTKIANCRTILDNASPQTIFNRGYSMVTDKSGKVVRDAAAVTVDDKLFITPAHGKITANVVQTE